MPSTKANLSRAMAAKNDEFYTRLGTIECELSNYRDCFVNQSVYCNCDNPEISNFWKYFETNFDELGLSRVTSTYYAPSDLFTQNQAYKQEIIRSAHGAIEHAKTPLWSDGDFRHRECVAILKDADIIVTNPPFSLFREFVVLLMHYQKKFLILGHFLALAYNEVFPLLHSKKLWMGVDCTGKEFDCPDGIARSVPAIWFTNLPHNKTRDKLVLTRKYDASLYPKFDHFDAINVNSTRDIPYDYAGPMGVPISFLEKYNPDQFEIIDCIGIASKLNGIALATRHVALTDVDGKTLFVRVIIRNRHFNQEAG